MILMFPLKSPKGFDALLRHGRGHRRSSTAPLSFLGKCIEKAFFLFLVVLVTFMAFVLFSILRPAQMTGLKNLLEQATSFERAMSVSARERNPL